MTIRTNSDDVATVDNGQDSARERLLDIAEQKFAEKGYFGTGLREIATAAGTTLGLINHHFGNKEALFRHVIERRASEHVATAFAALDAVVLSHAHIDHSGRLPLLVRRGFRGPIFATPASIDLARVLLRDAAHLQDADAERENRRRMRAGRSSVAIR